MLKLAERRFVGFLIQSKGEWFWFVKTVNCFKGIIIIIVGATFQLDQGLEIQDYCVVSIALTRE